MAAATPPRSRSRWRSPPPHEVKALKYEDAELGRLPVPVANAGQHTAPLASRPSLSTDDSGSAQSQRPKTAPAPRRAPVATASWLSDELKRDSGIAASTTTAESRAETSSLRSALAREPPMIVVHDADAAPSTSSPTQRVRSPFAWRKNNPPNKNKLKRVKSSDEVGIQRIRSFHGISTYIPTAELDDLEPSSLKFTTRGSLLFGSESMGEAIAAQAERPSFHGGREVTQVRTEAVQEQPEANTRQTESLAPVKMHNEQPTVLQAHAAPPAELPTELPAEPAPVQMATASVEETQTRGLVAGRRKPSIHMLQAAIHGGRVLSAEEITFSMRVRSMYEHGDEKAADWGRSGFVATPETLGTDRDTPDLGVSKESLALPAIRIPESERNSPEPRNVRLSYVKTEHELAGGIEDWEDIRGTDVDRYGFIAPKRVGSSGSDSQHKTFGGIHRVATGLRVAADRPRKERSIIRRGPSMSRSSRSVPANTDAAGSMRSFGSARSTNTRRSRFRSRDVRNIDEAGNMLMLPPGLADIAETRNGTEHADFVQRRETSRNAKWQAMARALPEQPGNTGGGMRFDFDTANPTLISRTWKGIPDRWRAAAWHSFLSNSARRRGKHASDEDLINKFHTFQDESCADDYQIDVDVPRTISMHIMFRRRYRGGQRLLFRILHAIAIYSPDTGYVQGMASLAATLLCYYDEERAFVMLVRLWELRGMDQLFTAGFAGLMAALKEFETDWLRGGDVAVKLEELGIDGTAYGTRWYLTLFNMSVPFAAQLRIWDVFMLLGDASSPASGSGQFGGADLDVLHATSAALIDATREVILESDFEGCMKVLTSFVPIRDEDLLMRVARAEYKMKKKRAG